MDPPKKVSDSSKEDPDPSKKDPDPSKKDLDPSKKDSDSSKKDSDPSKKDSDPSKKDSDSSKKDSDSSKEDPDPSKKDPDSSKKDPDPSKKDSDSSKKNSDFSKKEPDPSKKDSDSSKKDSDSSKKDSDSSKEDTDPSKKDSDSSKKDSDSSKKDSDPSKDPDSSKEDPDPSKEDPDPSNKIFNDPVHGFIELHPLLVKIINTPQFQRLKDIKQLGVCYWVFPGASHNRFEHCIGTAYLCGKMIDTLRELHSGKFANRKFEITKKEALCVKVAGLCHDLGHGPFSHFFDGVYIPRVCKKLQDAQKDATRYSGWTHEDASCALFDLMIETNPALQKDLAYYGLDKEKYFIKELIKGKHPEKDDICVASRKSKWFLYEIVANKRNGIDCDKFDYFARDSLNVGVQSNFDCQRYFHNIQIMPHGGKLLIHVRDKEVFNLYELFHTRWSLHHRVYKHKTQEPIEDLLAQALLKVDEDLRISASILEDMVGYYTNRTDYTNLTDSIFYEILRRGSRETEGNFKEARDILLRIQNRDIYKYCGQWELDADNQCPNKGEIVDEIISNRTALEKTDIHVSIVYIHFGMKEKDPIDSVHFFDKEDKYRSAKQVKKSEISVEMLPQKFHGRFVRVYAITKEKVDEVKEAFQQWCNNHPR